MSRVDVIIPCYNYGRYLRACVESVLSQEGIDVRVLVIDDASPDDTAEVGTRLAAEDGRVEFRRHAVNQRHIATYNEGLEWATGEYTLLLSADDLLTPSALARAARVMDNHLEVGLTTGRAIVLRSTEPNSPLPFPKVSSDYKVVSREEFLEVTCRTCINPVPTPTAIVRTTLQQLIGGYRQDLPHTADMEMWMRFAAHAPVAILESDQAYYRWHGQNMQVGYQGDVIGDREHRKAAFDTLFRDFGHLLGDCDRYRQMATRVLGEDAFWAASRAFEAGELRACQELLKSAERIYPALRGEPAWSRLRWKRRIGPKLWSLIRPIIDLLPSRRACAADM
jgi:glycosyltransferase involved in cell wall biosynthesis